MKGVVVLECEPRLSIEGCSNYLGILTKRSPRHLSRRVLRRRKRRLQQRRRFQEYRNLGICIDCKADVLIGRIRCAKCLYKKMLVSRRIRKESDYNRLYCQKRLRRWRAHNQCISCGVPLVEGEVNQCFGCKATWNLKKGVFKGGYNEANNKAVAIKS